MFGLLHEFLLESMSKLWCVLT